MLQKMAVIRKNPNDRRIAKIHAQLYAGIFRSLSIPEWNIDHIAQEWLVNGDSEPFRQHEMNLMNMEGVEFLGTVLDIPILDVSGAHHDIRRRGTRIEGDGLLALDRDEEG